jgi:NTP pyrophosphatase (non-canonical NTP hydrolase)
MALSHNGLTKLMEECGELVQVSAKLVAYPGGAHPDGNGPLRERLEDEMADVLAACEVVTDLHGLDEVRIRMRVAAKVARFIQWAEDPEA